MTSTNARYTPITGPLGCQSAALPGAPTALGALVTIPPEAYSAVVQGDGGRLAFRLDGETAGGAMLEARTVKLTNPSMLANCIVQAIGGQAASFTVQFYTGTSGW